MGGRVVMSSVQIKRQASYLCLILLLLVACKSKSPPTFDIVNSDAVRDKVEKDDIDGAIADLERQVDSLIALMSNQPNQPTTDNNAQMLAQVSIATSLLEIVKAQSGSDDQKSKIKALEEQLAEMKDKLKEKEEPSEEDKDKGSTDDNEDKTDTDDGDDTDGNDGEEETKAEPGVYLYLDAQEGAKVFEIKGDEEEINENKDIEVSLYKASIKNGNDPFQLKGYDEEEGVGFPKTVSVYGSSNDNKTDEIVVKIQAANIRDVINLGLTKKNKISVNKSLSLYLDEKAESEDE